jgi:hypothetical protein
MQNLQKRVAARWLRAGTVYYHLTGKARFKLNPKYAPTDNAISIVDRSGRPGIYLTTNVERWVNGHGYLQPFVVEFDVDRSVLDAPDATGRWGGELFVPATAYDGLRIKRVIPVDAWVREEYGAHGWVEEWAGVEFDTGKAIVPRSFGSDAPMYPFKGWRYSGPDVRQMPGSDTSRLKRLTTKARRGRAVG